jgi:hypothetical protein
MAGILQIIRVRPWSRSARANQIQVIDEGECMRSSHIAAPLLSAAILAGLTSGACGNQRNATPAAEVRTQTPRRATNQPLEVTGCLRAGEAENTFVLTVSSAMGNDQPATYQLVGIDGVTLLDHIGEQVDVQGIMTAEQQTATRAISPADEKPAGTTGTPQVETKTVIDIRRLEVSGVKPLGTSCGN